MLKCFLCKRKYDETKKKSVIELISEGVKHEVTDVVDKENNNAILQLCPNCVRAFTYGYFFTSENVLTNIEPVFSGNVAEDSTVETIECREEK